VALAPDEMVGDLCIRSSKDFILDKKRISTHGSGTSFSPNG